MSIPPDTAPRYSRRISVLPVTLAAVATLVSALSLVGSSQIESEIGRAFTLGLFFAGLFASMLLFGLAKAIRILDGIRMEMVVHLEERVAERTRELSHELEERRRAETALRASEARFRHFAQISAHWFWECDPALRYTYVSGQHRRYTGLGRKQMLGRTRPELYAGARVDAQAWRRHLDEMQSERPFSDLEVAWTGEDGEVRYFLESAMPVHDEAGAFTGYRGTSREVTAQKRAELALDEARRAAERASGFKSQFLANMSHEIRTPLNGVLGMTELLLNARLEPREQSFARSAHRSGELLLKIVNDILDLSRVEAGHLSLERRPFEVAPVVRDAAALLAEEAKRKGLALHVAVAGDVPAVLQGDAGRLRQVLVNLVGNAVKFTDAGEVRVECALGGSVRGGVELRFTVRDTGAGIAPELRAQVFEPFVQADASTTRRHGGTGLGLAISRQLVQLMGGRIGVEANEPRGAVFRFTVVLAEARPGGARAGSRALATLPAGARILVAEDNIVNAAATTAMLELLGCEADVAANGAEALEALGRREYALVLMDVEMPEMDGYQATAEIRRREREEGRPALPVIALTAHAMAGDRERLLDAGMDDYLSKPVTLERLRGVLSAWLPRCGPLEVPRTGAGCA